MRPWECVDHDEVPGDEATLYLMNRGSEWVIQVDGRELMGNREHGSEDALADLAADRLAELDRAHILVGGLGMGFTAAAALRRVGPSSRVVVAEIVPAVVRWNQEWTGKAAGHPMRDSRLEVFLGDLADLIEKPPHPWAAILADVDNGPGALTRPSNAWLYTKEGVAAARDALIPGGVLGIWSAWDDDGLTSRLRNVGFETEVIEYNEPGRPTHDDSGTHVLWMAQRT